MSSLLPSTLRAIRHRHPTFTSIHRHTRYTHSTSTAKHTAQPDPIEWLPLPRSVSPRKALMLLSLPIPPKHWPSHLEMASPLLASASAQLKGKGIAVNAIYDGIGTQPTFEKEESYEARVFWPDGHSRVYDKLDSRILSSDSLLSDLEYTSKSLDVMDSEGKGVREILVCTHGSRDCRCSDRGDPLVDALREEIVRRGVEEKVKVREIAHVGGHKYAANIILLPSLDMLSNLTLEHAPSIISHVLSPTPPTQSKLWAHWRGRYGLTEEEQAQVWERINPDNDKTAVRQGTPAGGIEREEVELKFKTFEGELKVVRAKVGSNLLDVGKENDLPSLEGVCGGNLECATCHLYLPSSPSSGSAPISEPTEEEDDMLGYALGYRDGESRLGCQIPVTKELGEWCKNGGVIGLPRF
ncbi:hypothetical protein I302_102706 [Kwoniella bestiolae CBS 10118]|uniref:Uncharacterized protein n=1 Tax=Kwoniella bestiolae CBS 10118 TaxID=1296100 RepID=A0A1B9GFU4_9TREE|nr:hypothetical protein I302_01399 [Kwoniella bestiolae CBS 10118]OCF29886.1 hypothetical protein I302_01399 [Kwoniella bestiolae CBS 10118]